MQYRRKVELIVSDSLGDGVNISGLKMIFKVSKTDAQTPNTGNIKVYNLSRDTMHKIRDEFTKVILLAGYEENYGVIFSGNITQLKFGSENVVDHYVDISAGDGDESYNFAVINKSVAKGSTQLDQIETALSSMNGVSKGHIDSSISTQELPRGKVFYGMARDYLRQSCKTEQCSWSIQDGAAQVIKFDGNLPNKAIKLSSKTGLTGTPELTVDGVSARCLLNPLIKIGALIQIDESSISKDIIKKTSKKNPVNKAPSIAADGIYSVLSVDHSGDTYGNDWYSDIVCLSR